MEDRDLYQEMASATARREKAKLYIAKWQEELADAEGTLRELAQLVLANKVTTTGVEWTVVRSEQGA